MLSHLSLGINCFLPHGFEISISHEAFKSLKHPARNALSILLHLINLSKISKNLNYEFFNFLKPPVTILNFGQNKAIFLSILVPNTIITCLVSLFQIQNVIHAGYLIYSWALKKEALCSSFDCALTTRCYNP
jgi:hypothetical protein